jgi:hypothetical protein
MWIYTASWYPLSTSCTCARSIRSLAGTVGVAKALAVVQRARNRLNNCLDCNVVHIGARIYELDSLHWLCIDID